MQIAADFVVCYNIKTTTAGFKNNCQKHHAYKKGLYYIHFMRKS